MLALQALHSLSLAQTEYLVADRLGMRFCRLGPCDVVPDANSTSNMKRWCWLDRRRVPG